MNPLKVKRSDEHRDDAVRVAVSSSEAILERNARLIAELAALQKLLEERRRDRNDRNRPRR